MNFEKKYWSSGEFTLKNAENTPYEGYVGIYGGNAYIFDTEELLIPTESYLSKINRSSEHFDRVLSNKLELPYKREDVSFAANDFLYAGTVKTILERLQANNDYIFRNSIISNSILPYSSDISMFATEDYNEYHFSYIDDNGNEIEAEKDALLYETAIYKEEYINDNEVKRTLLGECKYVVNESCSSGIDNENKLSTGVYTAEEVYKNFYETKNSEFYRIPKVTVKNYINSGVLKRYSFEEKGLSAKTQVDPYFYPQRKFIDHISAKSKNGLYEEKMSVNTALEDNINERDPECDRLPILSEYTAEDIYRITHNIKPSEDIDSEDLKTVRENLEKLEQRVDQVINKSYRYYDNLKGEFENATLRLNLGEFRIRGIKENDDDKSGIDYGDLLDIWRDFKKSYIKTATTPEDYAIKLNEALKNFNLSINKISFIIKGNEVPALKLLNGTVTHKDVITIGIEDGFSHVTYYFDENNAKPIYNEDSDSWYFDMSFDKEVVCISQNDSVKYTISLAYGTEGMEIEYNGKTIPLWKYKKVPMVRRTRNFRWKWAGAAPKYDNKGYILRDEETGNIIYGEEQIIEDQNPNNTFKHLKESINWVNFDGSRLVYFSEEKTTDAEGNEVPLDSGLIYGNNKKIKSYTPSDDMTAEDCFIFMCNNITSYRDFPSIIRNTEYQFIHKDGRVVSPDEEGFSYDDLLWVENSFYKKQIYNTETYTFEYSEELGKEIIVKSYKKASESYKELNQESEIDGDIIYGINHKRNFDKIPSFKLYTTSEADNIPAHDFTKLSNAEIVIKNIVKNDKEHYANLILFLMFETKILITEIKYHIGKQNDKNFSEDFTIDLRDIEDKKYIELNCVDPNNKNSISFIKLSDIKLHKNMLYVCDSTLNMVLRYDVEYLISPDEPLSFNIKSIKLLDILQGDGELGDKIYFNNPFSIDTSDDRVYIVDRGNKCVKVYSTALNFIKILKNGYYATHDIQCVAVNPHAVTLADGMKLNKDSVWIFSVSGNGLYLSIIDNDGVVSYDRIEDITLQQDKYTWPEEFKNVVFSKCDSNYYYISTTKRIYKMHVSRPYLPLGSLNYFKQRSLLSSMIWGRMRYRWTKLPRIYSSFNEGNTTDNELTWGYRPPRSSAEILDNRCFTLCGADTLDEQFNGDIIFHIGTLYDDTKISQYIKSNDYKFKNQMTFADIPVAELISMIKSFNMALYVEPSSFISSLNSNDINVYNNKYNEKMDDDYINPLTFNKMMYSVVHNLISIKNIIIGRYKAATNIDGIIVYDNMLLDDYFAELQLGNDANYFVHENEVISIVANRIFESIYDIQNKILDRMQTLYMAAPSYVNNTSRII
ncbi:MAG: hypothetical protein IKU15_01005 [Clostridia bacterium]|nr:hypothetical protein [Clostridia bacterium]